MDKKVFPLNAIRQIQGISNPAPPPNPAPQEVSFRDAAVELYKKLNELYDSPHFANTDERLMAIKVLEKELQQGLNPAYLIYKMKQLAKITEYKTKASTVIMDRYWEKNFVKGVEYRPFDIKKNL